MADGEFAGIPYHIDPEMPPGAIEVRSADQRLRTLLPGPAIEAVWQRFHGDPAFAEEIRSLNESQDYFTYPGQATEPIPCECCGTLVTMVPEVTARGPRGHPKPAIWEPGQWRKHTLRRCNAMRGDDD